MTFPITSPFTDMTLVNKAELDVLVAAVNALGSAPTWNTLTLASGYQASGPLIPSYVVLGAQLFVRGKVQPVSGSFAATTDITVAAANAFPSGARPNNQQDRFVPGHSAASGARAYLGSDGSLHIVTGATVGNYYDIGEFSGIIIGS